MESDVKTWEDLIWFKGTYEGCPDSPAGYMDEEIQDYNKPFLPEKEKWYKALELTPFSEVRCVILGQDPYPTPGYATGLAFSVSPEVKTLPKSLRNIFTEYCNDLHYPYPSNGDLSPWARQGVLLLNSILTVSPFKPGSHKDLGWEDFTLEVLEKLNEYREGIVFVLWGRQAQSHLYKILPDIQSKKRNHIIMSSHPSPLSANKGFFGSRPFSNVNALLKDPIDWRLP